MALEAYLLVTDVAPQKSAGRKKSPEMESGAFYTWALFYHAVAED